MKFNLSEIMAHAWRIFRKVSGISFGECLHRAWNSAKAAPMNAETIRKAAEAAGVTEEVNTWAGWKRLGFEVIHGSKSLFQTILIHASKGDGVTYTASFFDRTQVQPISDPI